MSIRVANYSMTQPYSRLTC